MRKLAIQPQKILYLVNVPKPETPEQAIETLLIFATRGLDLPTRKELLRILPQLVHVGRAWRAEYAENGCVCCRTKNAPYGAGGFCSDCANRIRRRMRNRLRRAMNGRSLPAEVAALSRKYTAAQQLFGGEE